MRDFGRFQTPSIWYSQKEISMAKLNGDKIRKIFKDMSGENPRSAVELAVECGVSNSRIWEVLHNVSVSANMLPVKEYQGLLKKFHGDKTPEIMQKGIDIMAKRKAKALERTEKLKKLTAEQKAKESAAVTA